MKIINYRPQETTTTAKVVAIFDIEDLEYVFDNSIYHGMAYRNWELRRNLKTGGLFVTSKWAYADESDPVKRIHHNYIEIPVEMRKAFNEKLLELLKEFCPELKDAS